MPEVVDYYAVLGERRADELVAEFEAGFAVHPLTLEGDALTPSMASGWFFTLAWWDRTTAARIVGEGISPDQMKAFERHFLGVVCSHAGSRDDDNSDPDLDFRETNQQYGYTLFNVAENALTNAWNEGLQFGRAHGMAIAVALKAMGLTPTRTPNYESIFEHTFRHLHERTMNLVALLRRDADGNRAEEDSGESVTIPCSDASNPEPDPPGAGDDASEGTCRMDLTDADILSIDRSVPGFRRTMDSIAGIEDSDVRAAVQKRVLTVAGKQLQDNLAREDWWRSSSGRVTKFFIGAGVLSGLVLLRRGCG